MGAYSASLRGDTLTIARQSGDKKATEKQLVTISELESNTKYDSVFVMPPGVRDEILLVRELPTEETLVVVVRNGRLRYWCAPDTEKSPMKSLVEVRAQVLAFRLTKKKLWLFYVCYVINPHKLAVVPKSLYLDDDNEIKTKFKVVDRPLSRLRVLLNCSHLAKFSVGQMLASGEPKINTVPKIVLDIDGKRAQYNLFKVNKHIRHTKDYYVPLASVRHGDFAINVRCTAHGSFVVRRRRLEPVEYSRRFKLMEHGLVSYTLYCLGKLARTFSRKQVNLYFEKEASKAEEGTLEVFLRAKHSKRSRNYFIIARDTADYDRIRHEKGVVIKFSLRSYWLIFRANNIIATEVPAHAYLLRSNNKYLCRSLYRHRFVFLQHGIIYMKNLGKRSAFVAGRDGAPDYMVVASQKEADVVMPMLKMEPQQLLKVGQPLFDTIEYNHITAKSPDIATVMLTWKPYEEHLADFSKSTYYKNTVAVYKTLARLLPKENVRIVAHPKALRSLMRTDLSSSIWSGSLSDAMRDTKLLITDYSSICYYSFYQGAAVIFYQPDLRDYEADNGPLIPADKEYIGPRVLNSKALQSLLASTISGRINMERLRTPKHITNYRAINEFHDGNNVERLYKILGEMKIV